MGRRDEKAAKRYARALFNLSVSANADSMAAALAAFQKVWSEQAELREMMENPAVAESERRLVLQDIAQMVAAGDSQFRDFLSLLLSNRRLSSISLIAEAFEQILAEFKRLLSIEVVSAFELAAEEKAATERRIREQIPATYASLISIQWTVDRSLIGGLLVRSGDLLLDGSLQGVLARMGKALGIRS